MKYFREVKLFEHLSFPQRAKEINRLIFKKLVY